MIERDKKVGRPRVVGEDGGKLGRYNIQLFESQWEWLGECAAGGNRSGELRRMLSEQMAVGRAETGQGVAGEWEEG